MMLLRRKATALKCGFWCSEDAVCIVHVEHPCGHRDSSSPVCISHLEGIHATGGVASDPAECPECHDLSHAVIRRTDDIPARP